MRCSYLSRWVSTEGAGSKAALVRVMLGGISSSMGHTSSKAWNFSVKHPRSLR